MPEFLHDRSDFDDLLRLVSENQGITPALIEKDYWIMHCLWSLKKQDFQFELKGGTSLSKGFKVIQRFSEDIDIRFDPPREMNVNIGRNQNKPAHIESRSQFYDWLAKNIEIPGIIGIQRNEIYDDKNFRSAGIRLIYTSNSGELPGIKPGILLEVGFDKTTPNTKVTISSWAFDTALSAKVPVVDNRATGISCYNPEYTFVEKLQTISTKYRNLKATGKFPSNFLRHYYDVFCLLNHPAVQKFIGTSEYETHKKERFRTEDELSIVDNPAFLFRDKATLKEFESEYKKTAALYYAGQPTFTEILSRIKANIDKL